MCQKRKSETVLKIRKHDDKILDGQEEMKMSLMPNGALRGRCKRCLKHRL